MEMRLGGDPRRTTGWYLGVSRRRRRHQWHAYIVIDGKKHSLGLYDTAEHAAQAYDQKASELWGSRARLNFS